MNNVNVDLNYFAFWYIYNAIQFTIPPTTMKFSTEHQETIPYRLVMGDLSCHRIMQIFPLWFVCLFWQKMEMAITWASKGLGSKNLIKKSAHNVNCSLKSFIMLSKFTDVYQPTPPPPLTRNITFRSLLSRRYPVDWQGFLIEIEMSLKLPSTRFYLYEVRSRSH